MYVEFQLGFMIPLILTFIYVQNVHCFGRALHESENVHRYAQEGDLNIGAVLPIHVFDKVRPCGPTLREAGVIQHVEALIYTIKEINDRVDLLPNIQLGFVILDDCTKDTTALAQTLHFMPEEYRGSQQCARQCNSVRQNRGTKVKASDFYDVVGVIGAESTSTSIMVANILGIYEIPQISPTASSDVLSDDIKYPYFMRMVPPDHLQVKAIMELITHFRWTSISVVYSAGTYGTGAMESLKSMSRYQGVCIGAAISMSQVLSPAECHDIIYNLQKAKTKTVVLFADQEEIRCLFAAVKRSGKVDQFVWVGSDALGQNIHDFDGLEDVVAGALTLKQYSVHVPEFQRYFESLKPKYNKLNPWFKEMWADMLNCTWEKGTSRKRCSNRDNLAKSPDYFPEPTVSTVMDAVYAFAYSLNRTISDLCPKARGRSLRRCVRGNTLFRYLQNVTFDGKMGNISFNKNGEILGKYEIVNIRYNAGKYWSNRVALWDSRTESLIQINDSEIIWSFENQGAFGNQTIPSSECGTPCDKNEIYFYFRDTCCWECRKCNRNEITILNKSKCMSCQRYTWPDHTFRHCHDIEPEVMKWYEPVVLLMAVLSLMGVILCTLVFTMYIRHNNARLIKATSRELSYIMLFGITIQYMLVFSFIAKPTSPLCYINYLGFNMAFTVVYAPLMAKTNRIYRIFDAGKRTTRVPSFTSPLSQVMITVIIILLQACINIIAITMQPPREDRRMPIITEKFVELYCAIPVQGLVISLCYNILLIMVCTYYAFKTRMLPDNFNESRYITLCVYTTLIIWLAFIPTYFTASRAYFQVVLLSSALILNASVTLMCLYTPKIYAIYLSQKTHVQTRTKYNIGTTNGPYMDNLRATRQAAIPLEEQATELSENG